MKAFLVTLMMLFVLITKGLAQTNVVLLHQLVENNETEFDKQKTSKNRQATATSNEEVNRGLIKSMQARYKELQSRFNKLGYLMDAGKILVDATPIVTEIVDKQSEIVKQAQKNYAFVPIALEAETEFVQRSDKLIRYIVVLFIVGSDFSQMKASDRKILLVHVIDELKVIRSMSAHLASTMLYANNTKSIIKYPFADYVNEDKKLIDKILDNYDALK